MVQRADLRSTDEILTRAGNGVTKWVLGVGLLAFHASFFAVTMIGLLLWNLFSDPSNLWVSAVFRSWATLLAFHGIAVAAGWLAWRLMRAEKAAMDAAQTPLVAQRQPVGHQWQSVQARPSEVSTRAEDAARRAFATTATWSATVARRTRSAVSTTTNRWTPGRGGTTAALITDPNSAWPERPAQQRAEDRDFIARFNPATIQTDPAANGSNGTDAHVTNGNGHSNGNGKAGFSKDAGWTWVETAAASWSARRDPDLMAPSSKPDDHTDAAPSPIDLPPTSMNDDHPVAG